MLRFDAERHEYWVGDRRLPSVSEVIRPLIDYSMVPEERLEFARDRGTAVHLACHLDDLAQLDESSVDEEHVLPRLMAWRKFKVDHDVEIVISEEPMYYSALGYAGTPDKYVRLLSAERGRTRRTTAVIDLKTVAQMKPVIGVQLSGYRLLLEAHACVKVDLMLGVQLRSDGTYRTHTYGSEVPTFMSLLTLLNWRTKHEPR